jgi:hypothetical protein
MEEGAASFVISGGLGHVPITFTGLGSATGFELML